MDTTNVEAVFIEGVANDRLLFGEPQSKRYVDDVRIDFTFAPGQVFGYVWWERNEYGTQYWACAVLGATAPNQVNYALPRITPGADVYLYAAGRGRNAPGPVERTLALIDEIQASGFRPELVPASYWRAAAFALRANRRPRRFTPREYHAELRSMGV